MATKKTLFQLQVIVRVKRLRVDNGESQQKLSKIIGTGIGAMGNIESFNTSHKYTIQQLNTIAHHYNVPIESLFMDKCEKKLSIDDFTQLLCRYLDGSGRQE